MAELLAKRNAQAGNIDWRDHREVPDEAIGKALAAEDARRHQDQETEKAKQAELAALKADWQKSAHEILDRSPPSSPKGGSPQPVPPRPPAPDVSQQLKLTADQVLQRFSDPALQARYQQQEQRREQETKSAFSSSDPATRSTARKGGAPDQAPEFDLSSYFKISEIKKNAADEVAARANDPNKGRERGGRGR